MQESFECLAISRITLNLFGFPFCPSVWQFLAHKMTPETASPCLDFKFIEKLMLGTQISTRSDSSWKAISAERSAPTSF
jgi:hypothetical protein